MRNRSADLLHRALFWCLIQAPAQQPRPMPKPSTRDVIETDFHYKLGFKGLPLG